MTDKPEVFPNAKPILLGTDTHAAILVGSNIDTHAASLTGSNIDTHAASLTGSNIDTHAALLAGSNSLAVENNNNVEDIGNILDTFFSNKSTGITFQTETDILTINFTPSGSGTLFVIVVGSASLLANNTTTYDITFKIYEDDIEKEALIFSRSSGLQRDYVNTSIIAFFQTTPGLHTYRFTGATTTTTTEVSSSSLNIKTIGNNDTHVAILTGSNIDTHAAVLSGSNIDTHAAVLSGSNIDTHAASLTGINTQTTHEEGVLPG